MEEFRAIFADRLALTLINRGQISPNDFAEREGGAVSQKFARAPGNVCKNCYSLRA